MTLDIQAEGLADDTTVSLRALTRAPFAIVLTNPQIDDNPIVYVNAAFEEVTGYAARVAIGRNCRFLQGAETDPKTVTTLGEKVSAKEPVSVDILNYRADGTAFWNRLMVEPLTDDEGTVTHMLGVQMEIDAPSDALPRPRVDDGKLKEIQHRVKNHLSMIVGLIRLQARQSESEATDDFRTLSRRVEALQLLYEEMNEASKSGRGNDDRIDLGAYLSRIANAVAHLDGRSGVRTNIDADQMIVPFATATQLGLILSEIMTNSLQHAFTDRVSGNIDVRIRELSSGVIRLQVADDGVGMPPDMDWPESGGLGARIVSQLSEGLNAKLSVDRALTGTSIALDVPASETHLG